MSSVFDYYYYLINLAPNQGPDENTGLLVKLADRRADRKRAGDVFFALLTIEAAAGLTAEQQNNLLERAAERYFKSTGSVTAGIREAVEPINEFLYARNLRGNAEGRQGAGILNLGVLHGGVVMIAHAGPTHTFLLTSARVMDWSDPAPDRGLGFSRSINLRFFQDQIEPGDNILFCPRPPASWTPALLAGATQLNRNILRRRLLHQVQGDLRAGMIEFQAGHGELHALRLRSIQTETSAVAPAAQTSNRPASTPVVAIPTAMPEAQPSIPAAFTAAEAHRPTAEPLPSAEPETPPRAAQVPRVVRPRRRSGFKAGLAKFFKGSRTASSRVGSSMAGFAGKLLPESGSQGLHLNKLSMLIIAIAVPVLVVALAATIYIRSGRDEQHRALLYVAQQIADQAVTATGAESQRFAWQEVLKQVAEAEKFSQSPASSALRQQAQNAIDQLDGILRLNFTPAMAGGFDSQVAFTRLVTTTSGDLYALDALVGRIIRFESTQNGYVLDRSFTCGPNQVNSTIVGPLVDIAALPRSNHYDADVMGIDANGAIEYCAAGESQTAVAASMLITASGWGKITAMTLYDGSLYVLDPVNNVVWRYDSLSDGFPDAPHALEIMVNDLFNAVDITMYEDDLFLLHANGQTTKCTFRGNFSWDMECREPAGYIMTDSNQNRVAVNTLPGAQLTQMQTTYPLEPSLYILDQASNSVYRFSVAMQLQYRLSPALAPSSSLPQTSATAFTVTSNQKIILAFNNQLYVATLPVP